MEDELQELSLVVEKYIALFHPDDFLVQYVQNARDLYIERFWVRQLPPNNSVLYKIVSIVHDAAMNNRRFRTVQCLKLIKGLVRQRWELEPLPDEVLSLLFDMFKRYVNHRNEEVQWAVTVFLKNQILNDTHVLWLIQNWSESAHIINRLLLYPRYEPQIDKWAERMLKAGNLPERRSELMSRVIIDTVPPYLQGEGASALLWGIQKAYIGTDLKVKLMENHLDLNPETVSTVIAVSGRLESPELLYSIERKLQFALDNLRT